MKELAYLNKYFYKYRWTIIPGILFVIASNYFGILPARVIREAFDLVKENIDLYRLYDGFERQDLVYQVFGSSLLFFGFVVLALSLARGIFLFFMRQTIILTSRHIEYDLKNEIYQHYQALDFSFFRKNNTGGHDESRDRRCEPSAELFGTCNHVRHQYSCVIDHGDLCDV